MVAIFGFELTVSTLLAFLLGLLFGLVIGVITPVEYRRWRESQTKRKQQLTERIYRPLYDELSNTAEGNLPQDGTEYRSYWERLAAHQRRHVGDTLQAALNDYSERLKRVNLLDSELSDIQDIRQQLPYGMFETRATDHGTIPLVKTPEGADEKIELSLSDFLLEYGSLIDTSMSAEEMHRRLAGTDLRPFVDAWDREYPGWQESFWTAFNEEGAGLVEAAEERQQLVQSELPDHAAEIRERLERRLD